MEVEIYKAQVQDIDKIELIENSLEKRIISYNSLLNDLKTNNTFCYIAKLDGKCIGYISFSILVDHIDILSIAVIKDYRKKGVATKLLDVIILLAKENNIKDIFLEVRVSNNAAISFYEKNGFEKISTRKNYYCTPIEDAYIFKKLV